MYSTKRMPFHVNRAVSEPLPAPLSIFHRNQILFLRCTTSMIAGTPGSYKSVLALNLAVEWANKGLWVLYFSADMDESTIQERLNGIITNDAIVNVRMKNTQQKLEEIANGTQHPIYIEFDSRTYEDVERRTKTFEAHYGLFPDVIILDNLIDFVESPDDWGSMLSMTRDLDFTARKTKSHIMIVHHAKLRDDNTPAKNKKPAHQPPSESEISGKITQKPRLVLTVTKSGMTQYAACVKQSRGPSDKSAAEECLQFNVGHSMRVVPPYPERLVYG